MTPPANAGKSNGADEPDGAAERGKSSQSGSASEPHTASASPEPVGPVSGARAGDELGSDDPGESGLEDAAVDGEQSEVVEEVPAVAAERGSDLTEGAKEHAAEERSKDQLAGGPQGSPRSSTSGAAADNPAPPNPTTIVDENPETLIDERRTEHHPRPFGRPGAPLARSSPFYFGFFGALGVLLAYLTIQALTDARQVLILIIVALFLAIGLNPLVERLIRATRLHRGPAVACVFLGTLIVFGGIGYAIVPPVIEQSVIFFQNLPENIGSLQRNENIARLNERYHVIESAQAYLNDSGFAANVAGGVLGIGRALLSGIFATVTVLILALYFLASLPSIKRQVYALVPASRRKRVTLLGDEILLRIGGYVGGMVIVSVIAGVAAYIFLRIANLPYALPLAIVGGLLSLIPMVGATIALVLLSSVAFFHSTAQGIATVVFYLVYQQVENYLIYPRVMRRSVDVPPALTVIAALMGGTLLGVVGALLAIPVAAAGLLLVREVLVPRQDEL